MTPLLYGETAVASCLPSATSTMMARPDSLPKSTPIAYLLKAPLPALHMSRRGCHVPLTGGGQPAVERVRDNGMPYRYRSRYRSRYHTDTGSDYTVADRSRPRNCQR